MDIDSILKLLYTAKEMLKGYQLTLSTGVVYNIQNKDVPKSSTIWKGTPPKVTHIVLPDKTKVDVNLITKVKII